MRLYLDDELSRLIYCRGFESRERLLTARLLRPGDVYVDIGANIGLFTVLAADRVGQEGRVFSFEPVSHTYDRLLDNIRINGFRQVYPQRMAVSDSEAEATIAVGGEGFAAWSSLGRPYMGPEGSTERIRSICWDEFAATNELVGRVTMMKLDVEGWESRVLLGARRTLSRDDAPTLYVEFAEQAAGAAGSSCAETYELLTSYGYEIFVSDPSATSIEPLRPQATYPNMNVLGVKRRDWVEKRLRGL